ncbi:MAG: hypothetical protein Q7R90_01190 [bacterium]|nr:hypothetical protein [bacterium]
MSGEKWSVSQYFDGRPTAFDLFRKMPPDWRAVRLVPQGIKDPREFDRRDHEKVFIAAPQILDMRDGEVQIEPSTVHGDVEFPLPERFNLHYFRSSIDGDIEGQLASAVWRQLCNQAIDNRSFFLAPILYGDRVEWDFHDTQRLSVVLKCEPNMERREVRTFSCLRVSWRLFVPEGHKKAVSAIETGIELFRLKRHMEVTNQPTSEDLRLAKKLEDEYGKMLAALK